MSSVFRGSKNIVYLLVYPKGNVQGKADLHGLANGSDFQKMFVKGGEYTPCLEKYAIKPQNNELPRGTIELVQERCMLDIYLIMVWLYRSPIPEGRRGYFTRSNAFYLLSLC